MGGTARAILSRFESLVPADEGQGVWGGRPLYLILELASGGTWSSNPCFSEMWKTKLSDYATGPGLHSCEWFIGSSSPEVRPLVQGQHFRDAGPQKACKLPLAGWLASWLADASGSAFCRKPGSSAESFWLVRGRRKVDAQAAVMARPFAPQGPPGPLAAPWVLLSCIQANPPTTAGLGRPRPSLNHCVFTGWGFRMAMMETPQHALRMRAGVQAGDQSLQSLAGGSEVSWCWLLERR